jgi:transcriptional regulator GlxA family with amidase domain
VAEHPGPIVASGNLKVIPHPTFGNCPRLNIVVPGGWGTRKEVNNQPMLDWLRTVPRKSKH